MTNVAAYSIHGDIKLKSGPKRGRGSSRRRRSSGGSGAFQPTRQVTRAEVLEAQRKRSEHAKRVDASLKAKQAKSRADWLANKNRSDLKGVDSKAKSKPKSKSTHKHWVIKGHFKENVEHVASKVHTDVFSARRHSLETGAMQEWLKKRNLHMTDANKDRYEKEVILSKLKPKVAGTKAEARKVVAKHSAGQKKPLLYKVVKSNDPMIAHNYVGKTGTFVDTALARDGEEMVILQFPYGKQTFHTSEVKKA